MKLSLLVNGQTEEVTSQYIIIKRLWLLNWSNPFHMAQGTKGRKKLRLSNYVRYGPISQSFRTDLLHSRQVHTGSNTAEEKVTHNNNPSP